MYSEKTRGAAGTRRPLNLQWGRCGAMAQDNGYETLLVEREDGIATITLNRPKVLNALCHQMIVDLIAALTTLAEDAETRAVIMTGSGRAFCAGPGATPNSRRTSSPIPRRSLSVKPA